MRFILSKRGRLTSTENEQFCWDTPGAPKDIVHAGPGWRVPRQAAGGPRAWNHGNCLEGIEKTVVGRLLPGVERIPGTMEIARKFLGKLWLECLFQG